ncbi:MAG TPA: RodZ domain-containing protein [Hyphomonadaceae bacterium]|nr:RodZ domain-containing protein [Hyphomonadaceae bacterium]
MSGVAKDDTNTDPSTPDTAAPGDAEAAHVETPSVPAQDFVDDVRPHRRAAPHLRVVSDTDTGFAEPADGPHQRIGAVMKAARENLGFSLDQVSKETRVHLSHLRAIEEMTPNLLGAPVYAKGYIKAYARFLGMDETTTLERYLSECAILKDPEKQDIAAPATSKTSRLPVAVPVLGILVVGLVGAAVAFFLMNGSGEKKEKAAAAVASAAAHPDQVAATAPPVVQQLQIVAVKRALLEVRSAKGDKYVRRYFSPGERYNVRNGAGWTVTADDGSAFEWQLNGQSLGLLSNDAAPVYAQSADIAAKRTPVGAPAVVEGATDTVTPAAAVTPAPAASSSAPSATAAATAPAASSTAAPAKPRPPKPKTEPATQAPPPAQAAATPAPAPAQTPPKDPALAAYPDQ